MRFIYNSLDAVTVKKTTYYSLMIANGLSPHSPSILIAVNTESDCLQCLQAPTLPK